MNERTSASASALPRLLILCLTLLGTLATAPSAFGQQHDSISGSASDMPPLPTGPGVVRGRILHPSQPEAAAQLEVVLYALSPGGQPGLGTTVTDENGGFRFEELSNDAGVIYLLGTRYLDVPYGSRVTFEAGAIERVVEIPLADVTERTDVLEVVQSAYKLDWVGARLRVQVQHRIHNHSQDVALRKAAAPGASPLFRAALPANALDWSDGQGGFGSGLVREGNALAYYGPAYPGDQEVSFEYFLQAAGASPATGTPTPADASASIDLHLTFPDAPGEVIVLSPLAAPTPETDDLKAVDTPTEFEGALYRRFESSDYGAGDSLAVRLTLPESSHDVETLTISRADFWVDPDDAAMRVTVEFQINVSADTRLVARPGEVLFALPLPANAEFLGVSEQGRGLGVVPSEAGTLAVIGPIPPGPSTLGYKYRVPAEGDLNTLAFSIARPVALLNVLVADTGIDVSSTRLHRRRPFRQSTRIYLHREAYQLAANEQVEVRLQALDRSSPPKIAIALLALVAAALSAAFLASPLRRSDAVHDTLADTRTVLSQERAGVYESIRDIEHDFETGKINATEHAQMRDELKREAMALLRREREETAAEAAPVPSNHAPTDEAVATPGRFCSQCGKPVVTNWQFCSHCGGRLDEAGGEA
jgi:hypothetical protein